MDMVKYMKMCDRWLEDAMMIDYGDALTDQMDALKGFWEDSASTRKVKKEFEDLNWYELDQLKRDYAEEQDRLSNPDSYYMVEPR